MITFIHWNVDPIIFNIGSFGLRWYSLGFLCAFLFGYFVELSMFKREKVDTKLLDTFVVYVFLAVLIGARLGHCIFYEPGYYLSKEHFLEMILPFGHDATGWHFTGYQGLASHGAAVCVPIAIWLFYRKYRVNPVWMVDRAVIAIALGGAFIRLGNLFNSEIYGIETTLPWGVIFERNHEVVPKHPTQLYESITYFIIFLVCFFVYRKKDGKLRPGVLFGWWLIALFGMRFLIEFIKEEQVDFERGMALDMGQWLSLPLIAGGIVLLFFAYRGYFNDKPILKKDEKIIVR